MLASTADVYRDEMPGGQYTNLYQQAKAIGLVHRWRNICRVYAEVNQLFGDIVKVTPSSKAVGDMALFMVTGDLTVKDVLDPNRELAFPESVVDLMAGRMGFPPGGFPRGAKAQILRGGKPLTDQPGADTQAGRLCRRRSQGGKNPGRQADRARRDVVFHVPEGVRRVRGPAGNVRQYGRAANADFFSGPSRGKSSHSTSSLARR